MPKIPFCDVVRKVTTWYEKRPHLGPFYWSLYIYPRPTHTNHPVLDSTVCFRLCAWSAYVCVRSPYFTIPAHGSVNSLRLQNEVFRVFTFSPLSCPGLHTMPPLPWHALIVSLPYQSLCLLWVKLLGEETFFHLSYKPVCLQCSVWTSNLPIVAPSHACVRNRQEEVHDSIVVCFLNSTVETFRQLACASPKGCHYFW